MDKQQRFLQCHDMVFTILSSDRAEEKDISKIDRKLEDTVIYDLTLKSKLLPVLGLTDLGVKNFLDPSKYFGAQTELDKNRICRHTYDSCSTRLYIFSDRDMKFSGKSDIKVLSPPQNMVPKSEFPIFKHFSLEKHIQLRLKTKIPDKCFYELPETYLTNSKPNNSVSEPVTGGKYAFWKTCIKPVNPRS